MAVLTVPGMAQAVSTTPDVLQWHPWKGKRVAYFGDSIMDPRNSGSKKKYWGFLQDWLGIETYVYGRSGRMWNDVKRQADLLHEESLAPRNMTICSRPLPTSKAILSNAIWVILSTYHARHEKYSKI